MLFRNQHFCLIYGLALLGTIVLMLAVETVPGLRSSYAVVAVLPLLIAATVEGQIYARHNRKRPSNTALWGAVVRMTALAVLLSMGLLLALSALVPQAVALLGVVIFGSYAVSLAVFVGLALVALRIGLGIGLATELRGQQVSDQ